MSLQFLLYFLFFLAGWLAPVALWVVSGLNDFSCSIETVNKRENVCVRKMAPTRE